MDAFRSGAVLRRAWLLSAALFVAAAAGLIASLFFKPRWLWMDEVLSYLLVSDPSLAHMNRAIVSGMDANPPLFPNLYWLIGHAVSLNPEFLRAVSIVLFAGTLAWFHRFATRLLGGAGLNLVLITAIAGLTYLNVSLSTQLRSYSLFFAVAAAQFGAAFALLCEPTAPRRLALHFAAAFLLLLTHNFGLFYVATSGLFFALLALATHRRAYLVPVATHAAAFAAWLLCWYPRFAVQARAGEPHSWIPLPTLQSFFYTVGELAPTVSARLERTPRFGFLAPARFLLLVGLWIYWMRRRLRSERTAAAGDRPFQFYAFAGVVHFTTIAVALAVTFTRTSIFLSRYLWPGELLVTYQILYACHGWLGRASAARWRLLAPYLACWSVFLFFQNRKVVIFPSGIVPYLTGLNPRYPVVVQTADYFLPIWNERKEVPVRYVLDWPDALRPGNLPSATVEYKILEAVRDQYGVRGILRPQEFSAAAMPRFYFVQEAKLRILQRYLDQGKVRVVRDLPIRIPGHRLLECEFAGVR